MPSPVRRLGRKTGPKPSFTRDEVVTAALDIGIAEFTLARVAERVGVGTSALYRLFPSREDLVHACLEYAARTLAWPDPQLGWPDQLRSYAEGIWRFCEEYPGVALVLLTTPGQHSHIQQNLHACLRHLEAAGLSRERSEFALDFIGDTVIATHIGVTAMRRHDQEGQSGLDAARDRLAEEAARTGLPTIISPDESWTARGDLERKVEFVIAGLTARIDLPGSSLT
ncbi:TetR/AcrR family transcriptional regulator [Austwickia chelonae]|uniref:Putative TetR family transcriptional regulator n=1 Tax=Austwickia chelonae NBRC 105200 TaxID=1184607 RepID=K6W5D6_9MICO|nr:TetR/AcrR family transcriptional regulator [Austwickia chelonae]GAB77022.1 putative TetR family transcriptional regulator [Austwickia chelonae NBRC 105200]